MEEKLKGRLSFIIVEEKQKVICPNCKREYYPELIRPPGDKRPIQDIFPNEPAWKREQLISKICSDRCWKEYLGVADDTE